MDPKDNIQPQAELAAQATGAAPGWPDARAGQIHHQGQHPTEPGRGEIFHTAAWEEAKRHGTLSEEARNQHARGGRSRAETDKP